MTLQVVVDDTCSLAGNLTEHGPGSVTQQLHPPGLRWHAGSSKRRTGSERTAATLPASLWENTAEGSDNCLAYERAATFTSAHHIRFSLLSGTILRRLKGESFDVEKMKMDCVVWPDNKKLCGKSFHFCFLIIPGVWNAKAID